MKILIAVPTYESIYPVCYESLWNLDKCGHETPLALITGYDCATARNNIAQHALNINADYVLMVDNDVVLPENALRLLLEDAHEVNLGYYAHRDRDNVYRGKTCICKLKKPDGEEYYHFPLESEFSDKEMEAMANAGVKKLQVHGGGMGCALIKTDVFRTATYPWFDWVNYGDANRGMLSEDLYFCVLCKNNGFKIYSDVRVGCGHVLRRVQWPNQP